MENITYLDKEYKAWMEDLKSRIRHSQIKAAIRVNTEMLHLYWSIGEDLVQKKAESTWGEGVIEQLAKDLQREFPDMKGFSKINLWYMKRWYLFYNQDNAKLYQVGKVSLHQLGKEISDMFFSIPWRHHTEIITKCKTTDEALFYIQKTYSNGWSRAVLLNFLGTRLYEAQGKAITNFKEHLPEPESDLAQELTKDPYNFDFLMLTEGYKEKELENALVNNISKFLVELGAGFAYMGRQYRLEVNGDEFFLDLLFYHTRIHAFCVCELKTTKFSPEHLGQLGFYVSAINHQLKTPQDNPTIGLLICKEKNDIVARYSLDIINSPIGISEYQLSQLIPEHYKSSLPSIEEIEKGLKETLGEESST